MNYKAVIFDLDGTLIHTMPEYRYMVIKNTLRELGVISFAEDHADKFWFETKRNEIIKNCFGQNPEIFWAVYSKHEKAEERKRFIKAYSDFDYILHLRKIGFKIGIVTGSPEQIASLEIDLLGNENFDEIVIARHSTGMPKPDPRGLEKCAELLEVQKHESLFIGNAEEDILTAKNAGILDVFLERGEYKFEMDKIKPSIIINSLYELDNVLNI